MVSSVVERPDRGGPAMVSPGPSSRTSRPCGASSSPPAPTRAHSGDGGTKPGASRRVSAERDPGRERVDPQRPLPPLRRSVPGGEVLAEPPQRRYLGGPGRIGVEQRDLDLERVGHALHHDPAGRLVGRQ